MTTAEHPTARGTDASDAPDTAASRPAALVVDDAEEMRELIADVLAERGWEVRTAESGGKALRMLIEAPPDLVILDLFMPGMTGFELRTEMLDRDELAGIPVIVLSAYWHRPSETLDAVAVLPKPIDLDRLYHIVDAVREGREPAS